MTLYYLLVTSGSDPNSNLVNNLLINLLQLDIKIYIPLFETNMTIIWNKVISENNVFQANISKNHLGVQEWIGIRLPQIENEIRTITNSVITLKYVGLETFCTENSKCMIATNSAGRISANIFVILLKFNTFKY